MIPLLGASGPLLALLLSLFLIEHLKWAEFKARDLLTRGIGSSPIAEKILIVAIDDASLIQLGAWPWPRAKQGEMITRLTELGARLVIFDITTFVPGPDPAQDRQLTQAVANSGIVVLPAAVELLPASEAGRLPASTSEALAPFLVSSDAFNQVPDPWAVGRTMLPLPELLAAAKGLGSISLTPDSDQVNRRNPLFIKAGDKHFPSLALAGIMALGDWDLEKSQWTGKELVIPGRDPSVKDLRVKSDQKAQVIINWAGKWEHGIPTLSARWLLDPAPPPDIKKNARDKVEGAICVVGAAFTGGSDLHAQPFDSAYPGVGLHANLLNTILSGESRAEAGAGARVLAVLALALAAIAAGLVKRPGLSAGLALGAAILYPAAAFAILKSHDLYLPVVLPELSLALSFAAIFVYRYATEFKETAFLREHFKSALSPELLDELLKNPGMVERRGDRRELTVMFTDIKGFTAISDRKQPEVVQDLLDEYFEAMTEIVYRHDGTIDKFMGDGIMAFWGGPKALTPQESAKAAVRAGIEMQKRVKELSKKWENEGRPAIQIRIGINTGYVSVGFFGSSRRREYTVLGADVNLTQRLEANCQPGKILISTRTCRLLQGEFETRSLGDIKLAGFGEKVEVFEVECQQPGG